MAYTMSLFAAITIQKNIRDSMGGEQDDNPMMHAVPASADNESRSSIFSRSRNREES